MRFTQTFLPWGLDGVCNLSPFPVKPVIFLAHSGTRKPLLHNEKHQPGLVFTLILLCSVENLKPRSQSNAVSTWVTNMYRPEIVSIGDITFITQIAAPKHQLCMP